MKKTSTLLALLLALLLSVSVLVLAACDNTPDDPDEDPNDGQTNEDPDDKNEGNQPEAPTTVTVSFAGGTGTMTAVSAEKGASVTLPACTLTAENAEFIGWATTEGGEVVYADKASLTAEADVTLYAVFRTFDLTFTLNLITSTYTVTGVVGEKTSVTIPATYNGRQVTDIDMASFLANGGASVTDFVCEGSAFSFQDGILLSGDGKTLYLYLSTDTSYSSTKVETVAYAAFRGNTAITELSLSKLRYIGAEAFKDCSALATVETGSVLTCGKDAFAGTAFYNDADNWTDGLLTITSGTTLASRRTLLIAANDTVSGEVELASSVYTIADYAFAGNTAITSVKCGTTLRNIGEHAFDGCTALVSFQFFKFRPEEIEVNKIGAYAFANCTSLESFTIPMALDDIYEGTFANTTSMKYFVMSVKNTAYQFHVGSLTNCAATELFYTGNTKSEALWDVNGPSLKQELPAGLKNDCIHYYAETRPSGNVDGRHNAWCYVDGTPTLWKDIAE